jgi:hypothetical protein
MKITNKHNLPDAVFNFLSANNYTPGDNDYSATTLLHPPQMVQLERRHWEELEEDAIDKVWSVFGSAVHNLLEHHASDDASIEQRLYVDVLGRTIGGQLDHYHDGIITDYKVTSTYTLGNAGRMKEWEEQQNIYAYLMRKNGSEVNTIQVCVFFRDWSKGKSLSGGKDYPKTPLMVIELPLWGERDQADFLSCRVFNHIMAENSPEALLPYCTPEDMWEEPTKYAVMKKGNKRATKLFLGKEEAEKDAERRGDKFIVEVRLGGRPRCEDYCNVKRFCQQYKEWKEDNQ